MAKQEKVNENFSLNYSSRDDRTSDTVMDVLIIFENPKSNEEVMNKLNTWLQAIGRHELEVTTKTYVGSN